MYDNILLIAKAFIMNPQDEAFTDKPPQPEAGVNLHLAVVIALKELDLIDDRTWHCPVGFCATA
jgi:hypothetical protein